MGCRHIDDATQGGVVRKQKVRLYERYGVRLVHAGSSGSCSDCGNSNRGGERSHLKLLVLD